MEYNYKFTYFWNITIIVILGKRVVSILSINDYIQTTNIIRIKRISTHTISIDRFNCHISIIEFIILLNLQIQIF